jgi:hypothetical protein
MRPHGVSENSVAESPGGWGPDPGAWPRPRRRRPDADRHPTPPAPCHPRERLTCHARAHALRLQPQQRLLARVLTRLRTLPAPTRPARPAPRPRIRAPDSEVRNPRRPTTRTKISHAIARPTQDHSPTGGSRSDKPASAGKAEFDVRLRTRRSQAVLVEDAGWPTWRPARAVLSQRPRIPQQDRSRRKRRD